MTEFAPDHAAGDGAEPDESGIAPEVDVAAVVDAEVRSDAADVDFAITFTKAQNELESEFKRVAKLLSPAGMFWVSWPKKSSGVATNVTENMVRDTGLAVGLVEGALEQILGQSRAW